jgi:hypothetical protein
MDVLALAAKSAVAVVLLVAGGAKMADVAGFATTVRLFVPRWTPYPIRAVAASAIALSEITLGGASLSAPGLAWIDLAVLAMTAAFVAVSAAGLAFYRGRSCRCFGALSRRKFDGRGLLRSIAIGGLAGVATVTVQPAAIAVGVGAQVMLAACAAVVVLAAFTAARALTTARTSYPALPRSAAR